MRYSVGKKRIVVNENKQRIDVRKDIIVLKTSKDHIVYPVNKPQNVFKLLNGYFVAPTPYYRLILLLASSTRLNSVIDRITIVSIPN